jgi:hypothetical protein
MTAVQVEYEDLETIVLATGVIKTIEGVLATRRQDPFVTQHLDFTEAHDRLAAVMRNATRAQAGTATGWDDPLTALEVRTMKHIRSVNDDSRDAKDNRVPGLPFFRISPPDKVDEPVFDRLAAKGCIQIGQWVEGVVWAGAANPEVKADPQRGFAARLTPRGRSKLADAEKKQEKVV